jgi:hypothetical protein
MAILAIKVGVDLPPDGFGRQFNFNGPPVVVALVASSAPDD